MKNGNWKWKRKNLHETENVHQECLLPTSPTLPLVSSILLGFQKPFHCISSFLSNPYRNRKKELISKRKEASKLNLNSKSNRSEGSIFLQEEINQSSHEISSFNLFLVSYSLEEKIFLVEGILKVRKKSGNRERCRKLSYEIASENTRDITTHPSKDMTEDHWQLLIS